MHNWFLIWNVIVDNISLQLDESSSVSSQNLHMLLQKLTIGGAIGC